MRESEGGSAQFDRLLDLLREDPTLPQRLIGREEDIVRQALNGQDVHEIAQEYQILEDEVWDVLGRVARSVSGRPLDKVESGGLGSDTDPGVTGGYGETAFGSIGNEPPTPTPEEPDSEDES